MHNLKPVGEYQCTATSAWPRSLLGIWGSTSNGLRARSPDCHQAPLRWVTGRELLFPGPSTPDLKPMTLRVLSGAVFI